MRFRVLYHHQVVEDDMHRLSTADRRRIQQAVEEKLAVNPNVFGKTLRRSLKGYRSLRSGNYRIVFRIENDSVKIFLIAHRSVVCQEIQKRL